MGSKSLSSLVTLKQTGHESLDVVQSCMRMLMVLRKNY